MIKFFSFAAAFLASMAWLGSAGSIGAGGYPFILFFVLANLCLGGLWFFWPFSRSGAVRESLMTLFILAMGARVLMFPFDLSDDVNRYLWEGKIQAHGHSPFRLAPNASELAHLRDHSWEGINHKGYATIYPPGAQLFFRLCYKVWPHGQCLRLAFILFDLALLGVLAGLARKYGMELRHLLLYGLSPLVLLYVSGEGHIDPAYLFFLFAALLAWKCDCRGTAYFLLGMGAMFKIVPLLFLPLFLRRESLGKVWLFFVPGLLAIPYLLEGANLLAVPLTFAGTFYYNGALFSLLHGVLSPAVAAACCWALFCLLAGWIFFFVPGLFRSAYLLAGGLLLCAPVAHPWYFMLLVAFLPFYRSLPWLLFTVTVSASFMTRIEQAATGEWIDFPLAGAIEYMPFGLLALYLFLRGRRLGFVEHGAPETFSVVIPTLNEEAGIEACIASVKAQEAKPLEIVVVDGGSTDNTETRVKACEGAAFLASKPGRGIQIAAGVKRARGDLILVLHGDSRLAPGAAARMMESLACTPTAVGGAFGSSYGGGFIKYALIAGLDNLRAQWMGISFGNQGQFFRKNAMAHQGFPAFRLMEDVELSLRMKEEGAIAFVPRGVTNEARRWKKMGYLRNAFTVIRLVAIYLVKRRWSLIQSDCSDFYTRYYGAEKTQEVQ